MKITFIHTLSQSSISFKTNFWHQSIESYIIIFTKNSTKFWKFIFKLIKKLVVIGFVGFVATFALYMFNGENKLIYYVVRPLLNKHYDSQVRDRRIV